MKHRHIVATLTAVLYYTVLHCSQFALSSTCTAEWWWWWWWWEDDDDGGNNVDNDPFGL